MHFLATLVLLVAFVVFAPIPVLLSVDRAWSQSFSLTTAYVKIVSRAALAVGVLAWAGVRAGWPVAMAAADSLRQRRPR